MLRPKKNSYKEFDNEKKFLRSNIPHPPHNFSNKSGAYQVTHDIFSMIAIYSALLGPQAPQTKFEYVQDAIRTYPKDLHRKTLIPGISFLARYASRTSGMSSSLVLTE